MHFLRVLGRSKCILIVHLIACFYSVFSSHDPQLTHISVTLLLLHLCIFWHISDTRRAKVVYTWKRSILYKGHYTYIHLYIRPFNNCHNNTHQIFWRTYTVCTVPLTKQTSYILHVAWIISSLQLYEFTLQSDKKKTRIVATGKKTQWQNGNYK